MPKYQMLTNLYRDGRAFLSGAVVETGREEGDRWVAGGSAELVLEDPSVAEGAVREVSGAHIHRQREAGIQTMERKARGGKTEFTCAGIKTNGDPCNSTMLFDNGFCKAHQGQAGG